MKEHEADYMIELEEIKASNNKDSLFETLEKLINLSNKVLIDHIIEKAWHEA